MILGHHSVNNMLYTEYFIIILKFNPS